MTPPVHTVADALDRAEPRPVANAGATDKKNYAERLSRALAECVANALRSKFPGITPDEGGARQEAPARTSKGFKKLDVNYSTPELGLGLGISVKTLNFPDAASGRYTKNYSRIDNELRAEATDYHQRQPYTVLVGVLFLPIESCDDANRARGGDLHASSFGAAVRYFRVRNARHEPEDDVDLFERFFVALYDTSMPNRGDTRFFEVTSAPPRDRRPRNDETLSFDGFIREVEQTYLRRNDPLHDFEWAP
jgi:hypothetical protein